MAGTFGYELDVNRLTAEEKEEIKRQIAVFKSFYDVIQYGKYYRLASPLQGCATVWETVAADGSKALVSAVYHHVQANPVPVFVRVKGLDENAFYRLELTQLKGERDPEEGKILSGAALMHNGMMIPSADNGFAAWQICLNRTDMSV